MRAPQNPENPKAAATPGPGGPSVLVFVVGLWRSGTSLLHALLSRHPQIALMYEAEPFELWPARADARWDYDWLARQEFFNQMLTRHRLDPQQLGAPANARTAALALYQTYARGKNARVFGEKSPAYHARLGEISRLFPDARFIIIWRDPLDCCRSAAQAGRTNRFFGQKGIQTRMLLGTETLARGVRALRQEGRAVQELAYPELVAQPETELRHICDFLGLAFDPAMLDMNNADLSSLPAGQHHDGVRERRIGRTAPRVEILPPAFMAKGRRYAALWHKRYADLVLPRVLESNRSGAGPGAVEQISDRTAYAFWWGVAGVKRQVLRRLPLAWWARLRPREQPSQGENPPADATGVNSG